MIRSVLLLLAMLAGCAETKHPLPVASGPVRQLNVGHWVPNTNELTTPPPARPPA